MQTTTKHCKANIICVNMTYILSRGVVATPKTQSAQGEGSLLTAGNYFESGKSECNNSGYKLTGLTWWP